MTIRNLNCKEKEEDRYAINDVFTWNIERNQQRAWLTNELYQFGFSKDEKEIILVTHSEDGIFSYDEYDDYVYIPSEEEAFSIFCYKNRLNASLQSLRDNNINGTNSIHGAIWTTDTSILDSNRGIAIDFDSDDGWKGAVKSGSKNLDLCLWPIMKVYVPKK